eukprot:2168196-Pyramimonas_sp.AAC.2
MALGLVLRVVYDDEWGSSNAGAVAGEYVLAFGLFGFAGGVTNWLVPTPVFRRVGARGGRNLLDGCALGSGGQIVRRESASTRGSRGAVWALRGFNAALRHAEIEIEIDQWCAQAV